MALNETRSTITAEQNATLEQLIQNNDRKGFYVALYEMTGSQAALDMAEISSSSGIRGGAAWAINEWMVKTVPGYPQGDNPVGEFSVLIANETLGAIQQIDPDTYEVPSDLDIYLQAHRTWDQVGGASNPNLGDYFPGNMVIAAHYHDVGNHQEALNWGLLAKDEALGIIQSTLCNHPLKSVHA
ncbi:hypothetical protein [Marinobacter confluentis]|uniref:Uncharacterized protein n=1 Tax=Marinobacter confluentis TaxID=1697557 RepID=A0A4Z1BFL8_9GAMM|nr:hypothetical protein [Marinobacter confluentis]TGN38026.1 hypothetical protein E5Q11_16725 [Marinobacter confluentis]